MSTDGDRLDRAVRLDRAMNERRKQLRYRWNRVAELAGMTYGNLHKIRTGQITVTEDAAYGIEIALRWSPGSVEAILAGGEPTDTLPHEVERDAAYVALREAVAVYVDEYGEEGALQKLRELRDDIRSNTPSSRNRDRREETA
ncbi:MAG TPA: hypothetical protein VHX38_08985 [Pseudonocardiaceae bacterium]|nr:hypothetical protein [Pseudonocardiaceae bacterium]